MRPARPTASRAGSRAVAAGIAAAAVLLTLALPAAAEADWGAIAVNPDSGTVGLSRHAATATVARHHARERCGQSRCEVSVWVLNGYAALVETRDGTFASGFAKTKGTAFRRAAARVHEPDARHVVWVFSG